MAKKEIKEDVVALEQPQEEQIEKDEFNPKAFLSEDDIKEDEKTEPEGASAIAEQSKEDIIEEDVQQVIDESKVTQKSSSKSEEDSDWQIPDEENQESSKEDNSNLPYPVLEDEKQEDAKTDEGEPPAIGEEQDDAWKKVAKDLGVNANTYEDFVEVMQNKIQPNVDLTGDRFVQKMKEFVQLDDKTLVAAEYKKRGYSDAEIKEEIDTLDDTGLLKREARKIRRGLEKAVMNYQNKIVKEQKKADATQDAQLQENRKELWNHLSKTDNMFGGKINPTQKEDIFRYVATGKFFEDVGGSNEALVEAAWLWRYKDQILKAFNSKGFEKGKKHVLDTLTNPDLGRSNVIPEPDTGEFNPAKFLSGIK
tara:strand:+ start:241 stop:1335 length:1095 start_codon:yes stop_codon:yes gene_type:complete